MAQKTKAKWFEVDTAGLRRIVGDRAGEVIANELVSNALDARGVTEVEVLPTEDGGVVVIDNGTEPWADLDHAFTLFARSSKAAQADRRGRFNLGEKLALAFCSAATIQTMAGMVTFDVGGRKVGRGSTKRGTVVHLVFKRRRLADEVIQAARRIIAPEGITLLVKGAVVRRPADVRRVQATLPTVYEDDDGALRSTRRMTDVEVFEHGPATLYEMGVPVCTLPDDRYSVNVHQKVPLPPSRDSVSPAYLRQIRTLVLNQTAADLSADDATEAWVTDALDNAEPEAVGAVIKARFGDKVVVHDPSDLEGTKIATSRGYAVISGGMFSGRTWQTIREHQLALPAGKVTPSPKTGFTDGGKPVPECKQHTPGMARFAVLVRDIGQVTIGRRPGCNFYTAPTLPHAACFGPGKDMGVNVGRLGYTWFHQDGGSPSIKSLVPERWVDLIVHELAHEWASDHLSSAYHDALTKIAARLALAVAAGRISMDAEARVLVG